MSGIAADLERQYPVTNREMGVFVRPFLDSLVSRVRPMLWLLGGAVAFLLLIACANVANVLLARGLRRQRETAVRVALGAGRLRIVRLFLCESLVVSLLGGAIGVLAAAWGVRVCLRLPALALPRTTDIAVDRSVLLFAVTLSITSVLFGLAPALQLSAVNLMDRLRHSGPSALAGGSRLRAALVLRVCVVERRRLQRGRWCRLVDASSNSLSNHQDQSDHQVVGWTVGDWWEHGGEDKNNQSRWSDGVSDDEWA